MYPSSEITAKLPELAERYAELQTEVSETQSLLAYYQDCLEKTELALYDLLNNNGQPVEQVIVQIGGDFYFLEVVDFDPPQVRMTVAPMIAPPQPSTNEQG